MLEWIGVLLGLIGVGIAAVALIKQQKLEERVKEKDKLRLLAKKLKDGAIRYTNFILPGIKDPRNDEDSISQLQMLSQELLSISFDKSKNIVNINTEIKLSKLDDDDEIKYFKFDTVEDVIEHIEQEDCRIYLECIPESSQIDYCLSDGFIFWIPSLIWLLEI